MGIFRIIDISSSGLTAERLRMDIIAQNIANANTTKTSSGAPYRRKAPAFRESTRNTTFYEVFENAKNSNHIGKGVEVTAIREDPSPFNRVYDPGHPDADSQGYVSMPNVDIVMEMVDMISATRAYEANVTSINATKSMAMKAIEIGK
jgi:flagellar basal-body rod protein FlgC